MSPQIHLDKYLYKNFWKMHLFALKKDLYLVSLQACDVRNTWWWLYRCILISKLIELGTLNMWRDFLVCPPYLHKMFLKRLKKKKKTHEQSTCTCTHIFSHFSTVLNTHKRKDRFDELMILKLRSQASISNVLWGFYENLGRDVYSVYQSFSPNLPTACTTTLLLFKCSFFL